MVRFDLPSGTISFEDAATTARLLEHEQSARLAAEAEQAALAVVYRVGGERDERRPYGGLLTERLDISERSAYDLIREGKLGYCLCGKKNYRISERAVRRFEDGLPPLPT
jgi:hypothetical protein